MIGQILLELFLRFVLVPMFAIFEITSRGNRTYVFAGYSMAAILWGLISVILFPKGLIAMPAMRLVNLALTPVIVGGFVHLRSKNLERFEQVPNKIETFGYAWWVAFLALLSRYILVTYNG
jgi:hypothetical protein